jgi:hypothetical protein
MVRNPARQLGAYAKRSCKSGSDETAATTNGMLLHALERGRIPRFRGQSFKHLEANCGRVANDGQTLKIAFFQP